MDQCVHLYTMTTMLDIQKWDRHAISDLVDPCNVAVSELISDLMTAVEAQ